MEERWITLLRHMGEADLNLRMVGGAAGTRHLARVNELRRLRARVVELEREVARLQRVAT